MTQAWLQNYDPFHNAALSTLVAGVPVIVMLVLLAWGHMAVHRARGRRGTE